MSYPYDDDDRPQRAFDWGQVQYSDFSNVQYFTQQPDSDDEALNENGMLHKTHNLPYIHPLIPSQVRCNMLVHLLVLLKQ